MFLKPDFLNSKLRKFVNDPQSKVLEKKIIKPDTIIFSQDHNQKTIFILHEGVVKVYGRVGDNYFPLKTISQSGYFGFESYFNADNLTLPTVVADNEVRISAYTVNNVLSIFKKNPKTYLSYMSYFSQYINEVVDYANYLIQKLNNARLVNIQICNLIKNSNLISSHPFFQNILGDEEIKEEEITSMEFVNFNIDTYFKFEPIFKRANMLAVELLNPKITNDLLSILAGNLNITKLMAEIHFKELEFVEKKINHVMELLVEELRFFFFDSNSLLKELQQQFKKLEDEHYQTSFKYTYQIIREKIVNNEFIQKNFDMVEVIDYLQLPFADERYEDEDLEYFKSSYLNQKETPKEKKENEVQTADETVEEETNELTLSEISLLKELQDEESISREDIRNLQKINAKFINNYITASIKKFVTKEPLSPSENILISMGILNKNLLEEKQYSFLNKEMNNYHSTPHVFTLEKWISMLVEEDITPSNDEMGITYRKYLLTKKNELTHFFW